MSDEYRGWAWTRAVLGVQAAEVHVCGDPSALQALQALCEATGDELVTASYARFAPLTVDQVPPHLRNSCSDPVCSTPALRLWPETLPYVLP